MIKWDSSQECNWYNIQKIHQHHPPHQQKGQKPHGHQKDAEK